MLQNTAAEIAPTKARDRTYEKIMQTAYDEFARLGYHGVKISRLCEAAEIANGTFYIYFKNKDALYRAVINRAIDTLLEYLRRPGRGRLAPVERDRSDVRTIVEFVKANRALSLAAFNESPLTATTDAAVRNRIAKQRATEIRAGQEKGEFRADLDPMLAAYAEIAVTTDVLRYWLEDTSRIDEEDLIDQLWKLRLRMAYTPPPGGWPAPDA